MGKSVKASAELVPHSGKMESPTKTSRLMAMIGLSADVEINNDSMFFWWTGVPLGGFRIFGTSHRRVCGFTERSFMVAQPKLGLLLEARKYILPKSILSYWFNINDYRQ